MTIQVTFRGNLVPQSKKDEIVSSHPSILKQKRPPTLLQDIAAVAEEGLNHSLEIGATR